MFGSISLPPTPSNETMTAIYHLLDIVANAEKYRAKLDELTKARDEARQAVAAFEDLKAKRVALDAERDVHASWMGAARERIAGIESKLAADRAAQQAAVDAHENNVEQHKQAVAAFEREKASHANRLAEIDRLKQAIAA